MHKYFIDFHVHTNRSDGKADINTILRYARKIGLNGLAITDHDVALTEDDVESLLIYDYPLLVPGVEVTTKQGHLLILGIYEAPEKNISALEAIKFARKKRGLVIAPHPFDVLRGGIRTLAWHLPFDAIEVANGGSLLEIFNKKAYQLAVRRRLPMIAGSDAHDLSELGYTYTVVLADELTLDNVFKAIKRNHTIPVHKPPSFLSKIRFKVIRKIKKLL